MNRKLNWSRGNLLAFEIDNKVEEQEYKEMLAEVEQVMNEYDKIKLFTRIIDFEGTELSTMNDRFRFLKDNDMDKVEKYAIVGDAKTVKAISKTIDVFSNTNIRQFSPEEEEEAKSWILDEF
ncbi:STAS/SEC14 domain-containing protein [Salipaludibacillus sp. CUR1]|uniref:STAS/SEC14 domain-containing protein n=1 Tax=Salipaludibacillus sp. CUR1 TaxID=2820003 RepID=UPI001E514159|nr:STAS/SEC14 domain-containing protein [Salipaludibacillus sp. CUR1]MCE7792068.1 STAS/SEC14 domain-containing protein [Salipaludibacillus sp. CUR1]